MITARARQPADRHRHTFLFTDVEGSTRLLHELGPEASANALAEHRRLIREACAREGGVEVDTQGDAFFLASGLRPVRRYADGVRRLRDAETARFDALYARGRLLEPDKAIECVIRYLAEPHRGGVSSGLRE